jgi:transcription elongation factor GreA
MSDKVSHQTIQLTQAGLDELNQELQDLVKKKLPKIIERVANAREQGDLSENADYHSARDEQDILHARVAEIEEIISKAKVVSSVKKSGSTISMGSIVTLSQTGKTKKMTITIVGEFEADPDTGKVSSVSPMGKAVMGKKKGDSVTVKAPAGEVGYEIIEIK